jgi:hypothetical protein
MAQPSVLPTKSRRPVPALSAYLSNPGVSCVLAYCRVRRPLDHPPSTSCVNNAGMFASGWPARTFSSSSMVSSLGPRFLAELALPRAGGFSSRSGSGIIALPLANAGEAITSARGGPAIGIDAVCRWPSITHDNVLPMRNRLGGPNRRMAFASRGVCPARRLAGDLADRYEVLSR